MKHYVQDLGSGEWSDAGVLQCGLASLTILCGVLGLLELFGLFLCALIVVRFHARLKWIAPASRSDICALSRELSRMVYLCLYLVVGPRQVVRFADEFSQHATAHLSKLSDGDLKRVVAYGVVGLLFIRVLAFGTWLRAARGAVRPIATSTDC